LRQLNRKQCSSPRHKKAEAHNHSAVHSDNCILCIRSVSQLNLHKSITPEGRTQIYEGGCSLWLTAACLSKHQYSLQVALKSSQGSRTVALQHVSQQWLHGHPLCCETSHMLAALPGTSRVSEKKLKHIIHTAMMVGFWTCSHVALP
jgi:hypothetical protein